MVGIVAGGGKNGIEGTKSQKEGAGGVGAQSRYRRMWYQKYVSERTGKTVRRSREGVWRCTKLGRDNARGQRDSQSEASKRSCV